MTLTSEEAFERRVDRAMRSETGRAFLARVAAPGMVGVVKGLASEPGRHRGADGAQLPDVCTQCGDEWCGGGWECEG